jgi:hypothetical protein
MVEGQQIQMFYSTYSGTPLDLPLGNEVLAITEGWPYMYLSPLNYCGYEVRTKVSGRNRQGGRSSVVAAKRGSTV